MGLVCLAGATQSWTPAPLFSAFLGRRLADHRSKCVICSETLSQMFTADLCRSSSFKSLWSLWITLHSFHFCSVWARDCYWALGGLGMERWRFHPPVWWRAWPPSWPPRPGRPVARHVNHMTYIDKSIDIISYTHEFRYIYHMYIYTYICVCVHTHGAWHICFHVL